MSNLIVENIFMKKYFALEAIRVHNSSRVIDAESDVEAAGAGLDPFFFFTTS